MDKPTNHTINFKYAMCSCNVPIKQLQTKESIQKHCKCEIKKTK